MLEHLHGDRGIEEIVRERRATSGTTRPRETGRARNHVVRGIEPHDLGAQVAKATGEPSLAATEVEDATAGDRPQGVEEATQADVIGADLVLEPLMKRIEPGADVRLV